MYQIDFHKPVAVHFIGIGGISMSGLAEVLLNEGFTISGSDAAKSKLTEKLEADGAVIYIGQRAENIKDDIDCVVYTAAVHADNPEYAEVVCRGIPMLSRAELLGELMRNYEKSVAVAGTHGKTSTTSMLTEILLAADADPTISVGGILPTIGGNIRIGESDVFVTEACEYTNSYHSLNPYIGIILNVREDHLDFFKDIDDIRESFHKFATLIKDDGLLVINRDVEKYEEIVEELSCSTASFSVANEAADYYAKNLIYTDAGFPAFDVVKKGVGRVLGLELSVPGEHNAANALAAAVAALALGVPVDKIEEGIHNYKGTVRRFEKKGELAGITIIDDYAHHPDEINATLRAARKLNKKIKCIFQPHTYTRTKSLMDEFAESLSHADEVILAAIYPARETDDLGISSADLAKKIEALGTPVCYIPTFDEIENYILTHCEAGDLLITMGAGDVVKIGERLLGQ